MSPGTPVPFDVDLSSLARRSVATFYAHLLTRPLGQALRMGIDTQIRDLGASCLSVLDFAQVDVLDYSCADEAIAKLLRAYVADERPAEAYFVARGVAERHREPLNEVLQRHGLTLAAEVKSAGFTLLGRVEPLELRVWDALQDGPCAGAEALADSLATPADETARALYALTRRRTVVRTNRGGEFCALSLLVR